MEEFVTVDGQKYYKKFYEHCIENDLWIGFARQRDDQSNYDESYRLVKAWLMPLITNDSNFTKGALMKYARENYVGPCAYKDVGKLVSKIISDETTSKYGRWTKATNKLKIRLRERNNAKRTANYQLQ